MTSDDVPSLEEIVAEYRALPANTDCLGDSAENDRKVQLLESMDEYANHPSVAALILDVLRSEHEFDLARIEAAKIIGIYIDHSCPLQRELESQLWAVFANPDEDILLRQHAGQQLAPGYEAAAEQIIERVLFDEADDEDVRHCAFSYLQKTPNHEFVRSLIPRLHVDPYWSAYKRAIDELG